MNTPDLPRIQPVLATPFFDSDDSLTLRLLISNPTAQQFQLSGFEVSAGSFFYPLIGMEVGLAPGAKEERVFHLRVPPSETPQEVEFFSVTSRVQRLEPFGVANDLGAYEWRPNQRLLARCGAAPRLTAFLSRSLAQDDQAIGNLIVSLLGKWSVQSDTVGIPERVPDAETAAQVRERIARSDGVTIVATPRYIDQAGVPHTFEYAHAEAAVAFAFNKPILIIRQLGMPMTGFLKALEDAGTCTIIDLFPSDFYEIERLHAKLQNGLFWFRSVARAVKKKASAQKASPWVVGGVIAALGIAVGYSWGKSTSSGV